MSLKIILTRKNAFFNAKESSLFGVVKYQIFFADKNSSLDILDTTLCDKVCQ
jgi:hypothetical protein